MKSMGILWKAASSMQIVVDGLWSNGLPLFGYRCTIGFFLVLDCGLLLALDSLCN